MKRLLFALLFFVLLWPVQVLAKEWRLDTTHSNFFFDIKHIYATVRGKFDNFAGTVVFIPDKPELSRFDFTIKANSVNTNVEQRDAHLQSADFFNVEKYPFITFKSTKVSHTAGNNYIVEGILTIKDVSKKVVLPFIYHGQRENPLNTAEIVAGLDSNLVIDRLMYHVGDGKYYKMGAVGKDVNILITLELLQDK